MEKHVFIWLFLPCSTTPVSVSSLHWNHQFIINRENKCIIHNSEKAEPHWCPQATYNSKSNVISVSAGEPTYIQQTGLYVFDFLRGFQTAARWETNGYCFPITLMAGSGTWLPCGMTPHPWLHPEVTSNLVMFAEANIKKPSPHN